KTTQNQHQNAKENYQRRAPKCLKTYQRATSKCSKETAGEQLQDVEENY
ncbi:5276_t:CDS:1, partial [Cetraspora pellucida]